MRYRCMGSTLTLTTKTVQYTCFLLSSHVVASVEMLLFPSRPTVGVCVVSSGYIQEVWNQESLSKTSRNIAQVKLQLSYTFTLNIKGQWFTCELLYLCLTVMSQWCPADWVCTVRCSSADF